MNRIARMAAGITCLDGWRRLAFAFAAGVVSAAGFAPLDFFPALLAGYAVLVLLLDGADAGPRPVRHAAAIGWAFAFGQFLAGFHWIGYAFLIQPDAHLWQMPFALLLLPAGLALYGGLAAAIAMLFWQEGPARLLVLAVLWTASEWLRGHLFTGFPWNLPGYGWGASLAVLQSASVIGVYGLSFLTVLLGAAFAEAAHGRWRVPAVAVALFVMLWGFGTARLAGPKPADVAGVHVRIVQPDIPQREKIDRAFMLRNWQRLITLSEKASQGPRPTVIVWPEAATPFPVARVPTALDEIALLTGTGRTLITGSERVAGTPGNYSFYNSLYAFAAAALPQVYDKFHLVPFGEYVPFAGILNHIGVTKLTAGQSGFSAGPGPRILTLPGLPPVTPLICYEIIFPSAVTDHRHRPGWFVNVTDDSWFGPWAGPRQHLLIARVRAIEEGLPVVRAANTGISAVIDARGTVTAGLGLGMTGVVDAALPGALPPTPYARFGDGILLVLLAAAWAGAFAWTRR
jgi:apolipoprotein N-acyltransferase